MCGLVCKSFVVEVVSEDTQRKDGHSERIATKSRVTTEDFCNGFVVVFLLSCNVPKGRVERNAGHRYPETGLAEVDVFRHDSEDYEVGLARTATRQVKQKDESDPC